jgi:glyoxylase-like metal-dependent hydrolase (beta-lactamase superfamily II)
MNKVNILEIKYEINRDKNSIFLVLISDKNEMILIDAGRPNFLSKIEDAILSQGMDINNLTKVIITHHDHDHIGSLAELKRKYPKVQIISSREEEPYISGKYKPLRVELSEQKIDTLSDKERFEVLKENDYLNSIETVNVDILVDDKDVFKYCGGIEIISTPGHMPGHIALYLKESKTLVVGDAIKAKKGKLIGPNPKYTLDMDLAKESMKKFLDYDIENVVCYHGGVCLENIKETLERLTI